MKKQIYKKNKQNNNDQKKNLFYLGLNTKTILLRTKNKIC